jgi:hypothetical protein
LKAQVTFEHNYTNKKVMASSSASSFAVKGKGGYVRLNLDANDDEDILMNNTQPSGSSPSPFPSSGGGGTSFVSNTFQQQQQVAFFLEFRAHSFLRNFELNFSHKNEKLHLFSYLFINCLAVIKFCI